MGVGCLMLGVDDVNFRVVGCWMMGVRCLMLGVDGMILGLLGV